MAEMESAQAAGRAPAAAAEQPPKAVRRVGSWTLGLVLIACGVCLLAYHFAPRFDYLLAAKLAPAVLIVLGAEVLICAALPQKRKYDFFSIFATLFLVAAALCVSFIPVVWRYLGPQHVHAQTAMEQQAETQLYEALRGGEVCSLDVNLSLTAAQELNEVAYLSGLDGTEHLSVQAELTGPYRDSAAFAAAARAVADAVQQLPVQADVLTVFWNQTYEGSDVVGCHTSLQLDSPYKLDWSAETMAGTVQWRYLDENASAITREQWLNGESAAPVVSEYEADFVRAEYTPDGGVQVTYKGDLSLWPANGQTDLPALLYEDDRVTVWLMAPEEIVAQYKDELQPAG